MHRSSFIVRRVEDMVKKSVMGKGTEGGDALSGYIRVCSPVLSWARKEVRYGVLIDQASETMHDWDIWAKAYAASIHEEDTAKAWQKLSSRIIDAGIRLSSLNGRNIVEVREIIDGLDGAYRGKVRSVGQLVISMDEEELKKFLQSMGVSEKTCDAIIKLGIKNVFEDPDRLTSIIKKADETEKSALLTVQNIIRCQAARPASIRKLSSSMLQRVLKSAFGSSEGADAMWKHLGYIKTTQRTVNSALKITIKGSLRIYGESSKVTQVLKAAEHPVRFTVKKAASTKTGKKVTSSKFAKSLSKDLRSARRIAHMPGRYAGKTTRWAARGIRDMAKAAGKYIAVAVKNAAAFAGPAVGSGSAAAGGTFVGGWVVLVVMIIIVIMAASTDKQDKDNGFGNYQYIQLDTEFQAQIIDELQELNNGFEEKVNSAAVDRTYWSSVTGFSETDQATHFEDGAYSIHFRDDKGNELGRLDINNSKTILDMAAQYCKYADWSKPGEGASEEEKLAYEQIKQYYLDYCKFLWVSTHRITLEEYRPGDSQYALDDNSGVTTDAQGICKKNGTQVWLTHDFEKGKLPGNTDSSKENSVLECGIDNGYAENPEGVCDEVPFDETYAVYGEHALCSHPDGGKDGWHIVKDENGQPVKRTHYICTMEHSCDVCYEIVEYEEVDEEGMGHTETEHVPMRHYCGQHHDGEGSYEEDSVFSVDAHTHTDYLWEYRCGGHMGAVIYLTVGNVSRLADMPPATDIDLSASDDYPEDADELEE